LFQIWKTAFFSIQLVENFDGEEEKKESFFLWIEYPTLIFKPNAI